MNPYEQKLCDQAQQLNVAVQDAVEKEALDLGPTIQLACTLAEMLPGLLSHAMEIVYGCHLEKADTDGNI